MSHTQQQAVLFDLDGTLIDTAPDLVSAINKIRATQSLAPLSADSLRPFVSGGSPSMLKMALNLDDNHPDYPSTRQQFLLNYQASTSGKSCPFPGINQLIDDIQNRHIPWGIVTNKPEHLTHLLLKCSHFSYWKPKIIIGGDSLAERKPHPMPVYSAAAALGIEPEKCLMVGDSIVDMISGKEAGCTTLLAQYGYPADLSDAEFQRYVDGEVLVPQDILLYLSSNN